MVLDVKPAGHGQDRLNAQLHDRYQRELTDLELPEAGPADGVGAIEVCHDIDRKLRWSPPSIQELQHELERLFASAPTVLQLPPAAVRGHALRSYLIGADRMRIWGRRANPSLLLRQLQEVWKRMAFNALVGNGDDHPRNHGLLFIDGAWQLAPAFDSTPLWRSSQDAGESHLPVLAMATGADGNAGVQPQRLIAASGHFGMAAQEAAQYLLKTSEMIVNRWEATLRQALAPLADHRRPMPMPLSMAPAAP